MEPMLISTVKAVAPTTAFQPIFNPDSFSKTKKAVMPTVLEGYTAAF